MKFNRSLFQLRKPWDQTATPAERRKSYLVVFGALGLLLVAGGAGYQAGRPIYSRWKSDRAVARARVALAQHDEMQARMNLRVAMSAGLSQDGYLALADYYESVDSAQAVGARADVLKLKPHDLEIRLALINTALRFHDLPTAALALAQVDDADRKDLRVETAVAIVAIQSNQLSLAHRLLDQMRASHPADESIRYAWAAVIIHHPETTVATQGRSELAALAASPGPYQLPASRDLLRDSLARQDTAGSRAWANHLASLPSARLADLLNAADGRHPPSAAGAEPFDPDLQSRADTLARADADSAQLYIRWLLLRGHGAQAGRWIDALDTAWSKDPLWADLRARAAEGAGQWDDLRTRLLAGAWGPFPTTVIQLSFTGHELAQQQDPRLGLRTFQAALDLARTSDAQLWDLTGLAQAWNWPEATFAASAAVVKSFPNDPRPYPLWVGHLRAEGDSAALRDGLDGWRKAEPNSLEARYNWALLSLLTAGTPPPPEAIKVMEDFYQSDRTNPLYLTGAAFARFRQGHFPAAAQLLAELKPAALERPERAPYAAAIFAAAGDLDQARTAEKHAANASALLPEERQLLKVAAARCGG